MNQLRVLTQNVADSATLIVSGTAAGMGADKLKTDIKGEACRVLADTTQIVATWAAQQSMAAAVIPASSLGPSSTVRVRVYLDEAGVTQLWDSGVEFAAPGGLLSNWGFPQPLNVNQFAFGLPPSTAVYFPEHFAAQRVVIDIEDPDAAFIDFSRLVIGPTVTTTYNANYGQTDGLIDLSVNTRTASGDLKTDLGPKTKRLSFDLGAVLPVDRARVKQVLDIGIGRFMWVALLAGDGDPEKERDKSIYGKFSQPQGMTWNSFSMHSANFEIEGF